MEMSNTKNINYEKEYDKILLENKKMQIENKQLHNLIDEIIKICRSKI
jgi:uncharacterized protein (DUF488 family)